MPKHRKRRSPDPRPVPENTEPNVPAAVPARRRRLFQLVAVTGVPLLGLALLELVLRIGGWGYPTRFFLQTRIHGRNVFVENDQFGRRFFPPGLARSPAPVVMPAVKPSNGYRIFLLGESAALGDPEPAYGFGRYLEVLLRERFPGTHFEVVCVAMTAINSHVILPIARECARHQGDLWVVYLGNNELEGPFGAGTVFGPRAPRLSLIRASLALKTTRVGQLLDRLFSEWGSREARPRSWQGMRMFLDHQIPQDDPARQSVYANFQQNLDDLLHAGEKANVKMIVSAAASNLKDCGPFASVHAAGLTDPPRTAFDQFYRDGQALETLEKFPEALEKFSQAARVDRQFAELQFRLGRCNLALTNADPARQHFESARDFDALPFRADTRIHEIVRRMAATHPAGGVRLVDAARALSPRGIPGHDTFYEHVHLNVHGNYLLARAAAEQVAQLLPATIDRGQVSEWASAELCDRRLALTDWNRYQIYEGMLARVADAPFTNQANHLATVRFYAENLAELKSRMTSESLTHAQETYRAALAAAPDDFLLREKFAEFLEMTGRLAEATAEWRRVCELLPHHFMPSFRLGKLLDRQGKFREAENPLARAATLRPDFVDGITELGQCLSKQRRFEESLTRFREALRQQPGTAQIHFQIADVLAAQGKRDEALQSLEEAIRLDPAFWEARYLLGVEWAVRGDIQKAKDQFAEVVRLRPGYALAHLNLGTALANQGKTDEALAEFREALRLDPNNKSAREHIEGMEMLKRRQR